MYQSGRYIVHRLTFFVRSNTANLFLATHTAVRPDERLPSGAEKTTRKKIVKCESLLRQQKEETEFSQTTVSIMMSSNQIKSEILQGTNQSYTLDWFLGSLFIFVFMHHIRVC